MNAAGLPVRRVFLADGDAMTLSARRLRDVLGRIRHHLPGVERVSSYCLPRNLRHKTPAELARLRELGLAIPVTPQGAFYLYVDSSGLTDDSFSFAYELLEAQGVAITPGKDFGVHKPEHHIRFAYTNSIENMSEGVRRIREFLST